jgi:hypothetical protein
MITRCVRAGAVFQKTLNEMVIARNAAVDAILHARVFGSTISC